MTEQSALDWTDLDQRAVDTVRVLAMDAVEKVGNGHPGTAMSLAPAAYLLFQRLLRHDPGDPSWLGRDRFVLSAGHSSLTLYIQLYLSGYPIALEDLAALRTWGSITPGHPEVHHTPGVETTTGPLGQGVGNAVGMAIAARRTRGLLDPDTAHGESVFDHTIWCIASDGDLQEGVSGETSSLAGTQRLGNLVLLWDDNQISIEDDTRVAFSEDVPARYQAYGWHVQKVDWVGGSNREGPYREDVGALYTALQAARDETDRPSFIALRTIIGWPAPTKQNTGAAHGSALGTEEVAATKKLLGFDPAQTFPVADDVREHALAVRDRGAAMRKAWADRFAAWQGANPEQAELLDRLSKSSLPMTGSMPCRRSRPARTSPPARRPAKSSPHWHRCFRNCGAARLTWPAATTPRPTASCRSYRRTDPARSSRATGTAGSCTSASASTGWDRFSTASRCTG